MPEKQVVLKNCGNINPRDLSSYLGMGGFKALERARNEMTPRDVINEIKKSELLGRGGAGFSCGMKWELAREAGRGERVFICNADEGEMGTFKDRYIIENDPFTLIEGLTIASYAIGVEMAYIYLRAEYHFLLDLLTDVIDQAKASGILEHLDIEVREGAGAYVCGEESALINSIEGRRGEARYKPPFPPIKGLWEKPTIVNNVETLMNIPQIIFNGAGWFSEMGTEQSKGTKVFSVSGDVEKPGVYELVMGSSLKELVVDFAGAEEVKFVQVGGAAGRIVPYCMLDIPLSYETILGSGGVTVFDKRRDIIEIVYRTMVFFARESCGKCTPCREGTEVMVEVLGRLARGEGVKEDIGVLEDLSSVMRVSSLCGLGQGAPTSVMDSLKHFKTEFKNRISQSIFLRGFRGIGG